jgi:hypothetical protein
LLAVLGMYALPLVLEPARTLGEARQGVFTPAGSEALGEEFQHSAFERVAKAFLKKWALELGRAICGNDKLYDDVKQKSLSQVDVVVGVIAAAISQNVPGLAAFTGLLTVLSMFIARTGLKAFCDMLADLQKEALSAAN